MKKLTAGEYSLIKRHTHPSTMGSFESHLWGCIEHADSTNLGLLAIAFPEHVAAYHCYAKIPGWWHTLLGRAHNNERVDNQTLSNGPKHGG